MQPEPGTTATTSLHLPPSPLLALAEVSATTVRREDLDGDNWPVTWAGDGFVYAAYGDGWGCRPILKETKANTGMIRLHQGITEHLSPDRALSQVRTVEGEEVPMPWFGGGAEDPNFKGCGLLAADGHLYHFLRYQRNVPGQRGRQQVASKLIWSPDNGDTWAGGKDYASEVREMTLFFNEPDHAFHSPTFLQAGQDYQQAQDGFVYLYSPHEDRRRANDSLDLARVRRAFVKERDAYEFFVGTEFDGTRERARWRRNIAERRPVVTLPGHISGGDVVYQAALGRYLLVTCGAEEGMPSSLIFLDAPQPWGPWTLVGVEPHWGGDRPGDWRYDPRLPASWFGADGLSAILLYSDRIPSDKLNAQSVRFTHRAEASSR